MRWGKVEEGEITEVKVRGANELKGIEQTTQILLRMFEGSRSAEEVLRKRYESTTTVLP